MSKKKSLVDLSQEILIVRTEAIDVSSFLRCIALCISNIHKSVVQSEALIGTKHIILELLPSHLESKPMSITVYYIKLLFYVLQDHTLLKPLTSKSSWWFNSSKLTIKHSPISICCY